LKDDAKRSRKKCLRGTIGGISKCSSGERNNVQCMGGHQKGKGIKKSWDWSTDEKESAKGRKVVQ